MLMVADRSRFALKEPAALEALLVYDWRMRGVLTDEEVLGQALSRAGTTSMLRHLQRQGLIRALHGVRTQGGRMRLWLLSDVLRVQVLLDLRAATGAHAGACVQAILTGGPGVESAFEGWRSHIGIPSGASVSPAPADAVLHDADALAGFVIMSVRDFVARHRFDAVSQPAFLI